MKPLSASDKHMFLDMQRTSDRLIAELIEDTNDIKNIVTIERIANILISRMRKFLRIMDEDDTLVLLKELQSLKKMKVSDKKLLVKIIKRFLV
ncbi:MAG: hypothetical protein IJV92_08540 [Phascolarctobacterium sp.]|nr:hypothetical protein [Phascolarctobacterium sp.]